MKPHYLCMIIPSRWFAGGKGLDSFREKMLNDKRLKELHDFPNSSDIFPGVELKGGANYFLWQNNYKGNCLIKTYENSQCISEMIRPLKEKNTDVLIRYNDAIPILRKVQSFKENSFKEFVSARKPFGLNSTVRGSEKRSANDIQLYQTKSTAFYDRDKITQNINWIDEHKVYIGKAYGAGEGFPHQILNYPLYGEPNSCCTETYLVIGPFASKQHSENVISYIKTRFFRFLVLLKKPTQNTSSSTYEFVPQQNFDEQWTDEKLYEKYGLTDDERAYIEKMIRPMD